VQPAILGARVSSAVVPAMPVSAPAFVVGEVVADGLGEH
jgi:hypothetical protein